MIQYGVLNSLNEATSSLIALKLINMKKIYTTILLTSFAFLGFSQSIMLLGDDSLNVTNTIIDVNITPSSSHLQQILVSNTSPMVKSYKVRRTIFSMDTSDSTQFCWGGLCYGYSTNVSSMTQSINPSDTINFVGNGFHAIFNAGPSLVTRLVHYQFYDPSNLSDSSGVTIRYNAFVSVNELPTISGTISNAFPNPANSFVSFKYNMNEFSHTGKIEFYDVLGKNVKIFELTDKQGIAKINISELNTGIYFYSFVVDEKAIATKKLVISSK